MDLEPDKALFFLITDGDGNKRIDSFLASQVTDLTRSRIQELIKNGSVKVNGSSPKTSYRIKVGDTIHLRLSPVIPCHLEPEFVDFTVIHEDSSLIVLNKPAGIVTHPAPGHRKGTLVQGLLQYCQDLSVIGGVSRPGIVHRLDKDTSGLMVVAKNDQAHVFLARQFRKGSVNKKYLALVHGNVKPSKGQIDLPIARHPKKRKEMSVLTSKGRNALTRWEKVEEFSEHFSLLIVRPMTGRTHQIRVHLSHLGHPILGDPVYGYKKRWWKKYPVLLTHIEPLLKRQMLHAKGIRFVHPDSKDYREFSAPVPDDMKNIIEKLRLMSALE